MQWHTQTHTFSVIQSHDMAGAVSADVQPYFYALDFDGVLCDSAKETGTAGLSALCALLDKKVGECVCPLHRRASALYVSVCGVCVSRVM